tara:strand:+ start:128 stop:751 length:624 start_codon:yes stop_codon:yes gene_type:complete
MKKAEKVPEEKNKGSFKSRRLDCISTFVTENEAMDYSRNGREKKEYYTVAVRHNHFAKYFPEHRINTDLVEFLCNEKQVATKTTIYIGEEPYATGLALEKFDFGYVNKTSALENCETSSLGRALAAFGLHGSEFSSADELANAIVNQNSSKKVNQNSIKEQIKQQTTQTKLTSLFTKWDEENDSIKELFKQQETTIKKNGGQNVKDW